MTWRDVVGFEGRYEVSDTGVIRNIRFGRAQKTRLDSDGYSIVDLRNGTKRKTAKVHRLVLEAFVGPAPADKPEVDHRNRLRSDNRLENLRWATISTNRLNNIRNAGASKVRGVRARRGGWQAYASVDGRFKSLGYFPTRVDAAAARQRHDATVLA